MIRIAVFDDDKANIEKLNAFFDFYVVNRNTEYGVFWFIGTEGLQRIEKYASNFHMAFVSFQASGSQEFCEQLYKMNPNCRICYYNANKSFLLDISNPLWFLDESDECQKEKIIVADKIDRLFYGFKHFGNLLIFETRQLLHIVPVEDVVYFQSDLKYVNIVCQDGSQISIYKKLDEVENMLSNIFLRIHKSYIVNKLCIEKVDKAGRVVILKNGEELPISNSKYTGVLEELLLRI